MRITYETHYKSKREDDRHTSSMAAHMAFLRDLKPKLAFSDKFTKEEFLTWKKDVRNKVNELLLLPEFTKQPEPKMISSVKRDTYTVEKWEFYPDDYTAVPFLMLIPDGVTKENPAPGVLCFPGSTYSKEFLAGEPMLENMGCRYVKYPERNRMALYMVQAGMVAFAFDPLEIAECGLEIDKENWGYTRAQLCHGYIQSGFCYPGISVFQKLVFMKFLKTLDFVDQKKIGVASHSLGATDAVLLGLLCDDISAVVFNDFICDQRQRYCATTESEEDFMRNNAGNWHEIPGLFQYFARPDLLSALAPLPLALTEGGAQYFLDKIISAYNLCDAKDNLVISHYPKYKDEESRSKLYEPPLYGLTAEEYSLFCNCDAPDHSFRKEVSLDFFKRVFSLE
ncbi:MAG: hypothetical protein II998_09670 [Clostridia bacterium]|nr:hypothetical protein [Clostridia bacterium]